MSDSAHINLQQQIVRRLLDAGLGFGSGSGQCPVIAQDEGDLLVKIETALGKAGLIALATVPALSCSIVSANPPVYDRVSARVEVYEAGIVNRDASGSGISALEWAERAARALQGFVPAGRAAQFYLDPDGSIVPEAHPDLVIYHVKLKLGKR